MSHSLARLYIHLVFSTKYRQRIISDTVRDALHAYMAMALQDAGCRPILINSVEDHVHILFELGRTIALSNAVEKVKRSSSKWIKTQGAEFDAFAWQNGYGAFSVSTSIVPTVRNYIARQREHHRLKSFQEEYLVFLHQHGLVYDERYLWD